MDNSIEKGKIMIVQSYLTLKGKDSRTSPNFCPRLLFAWFYAARSFTTTLEFVLFNFLLFIFSQYTVEGSVKVTNVVFQSAINHTKIPQLQHFFVKGVAQCTVKSIICWNWNFLRKLGNRRKKKDSNFISWQGHLWAMLLLRRVDTEWLSFQK